MIRTIRVSLFAALACLTVGVSPAAFANDWASDAFPVKKHDFGTVAVAAKTEFRFPIRNTTNQDLHIRDVRASCGCTTPIVETPTIAPGQEGVLVARFNTRTFKGQRGATLTVIFDRPQYREVRLRVDGYIRSDIVLYPGELDFGKSNQGESLEKDTKLMYAGRSSWEVVDIQSNQPWLLPSFEQVLRGNGRVDYAISVKLREDAPLGFFRDELVIVTNDGRRPRVPLRVSGSVESRLKISPQAIGLGRLKPGETVRERLIVRAEQPFVVESIECENWNVEFAPVTEAKTTHLIWVEFTPTAEATGPQKLPVVIKVAGEQSFAAKALLTAEVREQ